MQLSCYSCCPLISCRWNDGWLKTAISHHILLLLSVYLSVCLLYLDSMEQCPVSGIWSSLFLSFCTLTLVVWIAGKDKGTLLSNDHLQQRKARNIILKCGKDSFIHFSCQQAWVEWNNVKTKTIIVTFVSLSTAVANESHQNRRCIIWWWEWIQPSNWTGLRCLGKRQIHSGEETDW